MKKTGSDRTIAAANGIADDTAFGAVVPPLYASTTYAFPDFEKPGPYEYGRSHNPTRDLLADTIAKLEGGAGAVVVASGMAAVDLVLAQLAPGALVVAPHDCYAGTYRLLTKRAERRQLEVTFVDQGEQAALDGALAKRPALVLLETPSNPLMRIVDIGRIAEQAKRAGALVAADNTFLSPALQKPISLGADYVIHSTTKYLNGHSDVVGGAVVAAEKSKADGLAEWANIVGTTGSPSDAYLTLRGVRTLFPRIEAQQKTAQQLAEFLAGSKKVSAVHYPGLATHAGHDIARRQQAGFGAMLSFAITGDVRTFVRKLALFTLAESLGGVESLIAHPATMTHASMSQEARTRAGIGDSLLRLSVGLEAVEDLQQDLANALAGI
jgi:cystathionine gamma-synthase